ncbi:MAG: DNA methyltransferase [Candidatus Acidiferrales bacterium]
METSDLSHLKVTYRPVGSLTAYANNARQHSRHQIRQIAASIKAFGFTNPVLINQNDIIIAGHGRVAAAKLLNLDQVPTIRLDSLSEDQVRAYVIADNRLAEKAGWDKSILAIELQHLLTIDSNLDVTITGFEIPEIDLILSQAVAEPDPDEKFEIDQSNQAVTKDGDLWVLGKHRILCGNALEENCYRALMASRRADVVFVDPPYNVPIEGNVSGHGSIHHCEFAMASGEMNEAEFVAFLTTSLRRLARHSTSGSIHFVCMDWRHASELLAAGDQIYEALLNLCVWVKNNGGIGSFYRSRHELVFVFKNAKGTHRNNVQLGRYGRNRTNVWEYPSVSAISRQGDEGNLLALHPTVKPVALIADALLDCSARGGIVLDSFLGSGSTLIAAERVGRVCYGIEIDPIYVDVAIRRWQRHTGDHAIHAPTGKLFDDLAAASEVSRG